MASLKGNRKVAKKRGKAWKNKLVIGKKEARLFPSELYLVRTKKGLSQTDIANNIGISLATYGAIERGKRAVKLPVMKEISKKFNMKYTDLFLMSKNGKGLVKVVNH